MTAAASTFNQSGYPEGQDMTQRRMIFYGKLAIGASPLTYPKGGLPITIAPSNSGNFPGLSAQKGARFATPRRAEFQSRSGSGYFYFWTTADLWTALFKSNAVALGQCLNDSNGNLQVCTTSGTAGSGAEPTWAIPTDAAPNPTTTDNSVVWTCQGPTNGLVQIFQAGAGSGTISAPTITTASGNPATAPIGVITGALAQTSGASGITGVQAPTFTGTGGALIELAQALVIPAGVSGDTISAKLEYIKG